MSEVHARFICCCCCGNVIAKSLPGTETEIKCPQCQALIYYLVGRNGVIVIPKKEPKKSWSTIDIPKFIPEYGNLT